MAGSMNAVAFKADGGLSEKLLQQDDAPMAARLNKAFGSFLSEDKFPVVEALQAIHNNVIDEKHRGFFKPCDETAWASFTTSASQERLQDTRTRNPWKEPYMAAMQGLNGVVNADEANVFEKLSSLKAALVIITASMAMRMKEGRCAFSKLWGVLKSLMSAARGVRSECLMALAGVYAYWLTVDTDKA